MERDGIEQNGTATALRLGELPTEGRNPRSEGIDRLSTIKMLTVINDEDALVAGAVRRVLPEIAGVVDAISARFAEGGRLFYVGAGTSGRLGVLDASECPPTFSVDPGLFVGLIAGGEGALRRSSEKSEDRAEEGERDLAAYGVTERDTVLGIAASGRTPYVVGALEFARRAGALTVALTCAGVAGRANGSAMAEAAEMGIEVATGAEVLTGSTRMKAGTATKMVLNMISTGVMIRAWRGLWEPDGERAADQCKAGGSGAEDHCGGDGVRCGGGGAAARRGGRCEESRADEAVGDRGV